VSRGHGKIQRAILAALEPTGTGKNVGRLVAELFPGLPMMALSERTHQITVPPTNAAESLRRALRTLAAEGRVEREAGKWGRWFLAGWLEPLPTELQGIRRFRFRRRPSSTRG
jgi:hypothetical protein